MSDVLQNTCRIFYLVDGAARKGSNDLRIGNRWERFECPLKKQLPIFQLRPGTSRWGFRPSMISTIRYGTGISGSRRTAWKKRFPWPPNKQLLGAADKRVAKWAAAAARRDSYRTPTRPQCRTWACRGGCRCPAPLPPPADPPPPSPPPPSGLQSKEAKILIKRNIKPLILIDNTGNSN